MGDRELAKIDPRFQEVIRESNSEIPVRLGELARRLGVHQIKISNLDLGKSGRIKKEGQEYVITVNRNEARERQRFTIAHELAHFLLHRDIIDRSAEGITDNVLYRSGASEWVEFEANRLAAELIMPTDQVKKILDSEYQGIVTEAVIENLASRFCVSKTAMELKLNRVSKVK
jgi:Zn-dependent peptidase ImmA (M78 family)